MSQFVDACLLPVPEANLDTYKAMATEMRALWLEHGAIEHIEAVAEDVQAGQQTDFLRTVGLQDGETVVMAFQTFESRAERDRIRPLVMHDERMKDIFSRYGGPPFDGKRAVLGGFEARVSAGKGDRKGAYADGYIVPVPKDKVDDYLKLANIASEVWLDHGAVDYVENIAADVSPGQHTDFLRSVNLQDDEVVFFSWARYPSRAERDNVGENMMEDPRMKDFGPENMPFDGMRMVWGGFTVILGQ